MKLFRYKLLWYLCFAAIGKYLMETGGGCVDYAAHRAAVLVQSTDGMEDVWQAAKNIQENIENGEQNVK
jgi:hypothetical protein